MKDFIIYSGSRGFEEPNQKSFAKWIRTLEHKEGNEADALIELPGTWLRSTSAHTDGLTIHFELFAYWRSSPVPKSERRAFIQALESNLRVVQSTRICTRRTS